MAAQHQRAEKVTRSEVEQHALIPRVSAPTRTEARVHRPCGWTKPSSATGPSATRPSFAFCSGPDKAQSGHGKKPAPAPSRSSTTATSGVCFDVATPRLLRVAIVQGRIIAES